MYKDWQWVTDNFITYEDSQFYAGGFDIANDQLFSITYSPTDSWVKVTKGEGIYFRKGELQYNYSGITFTINFSAGGATKTITGALNFGYTLCPGDMQGLFQVSVIEQHDSTAANGA